MFFQNDLQNRENPDRLCRVAANLLGSFNVRRNPPVTARCWCWSCRDAIQSAPPERA